MDFKKLYLDQLVKMPDGTPPEIYEVMAEMYGAKQASLEAVATAALPANIRYLRDSADFYEEESKRAADSGAFLSACIMTAAALECLLMMIAFLYEDDVLRSSVFLNRDYKRGTPSIIQLGLGDLIQLAITMDWLEPKWADPKWSDYVSKNGPTLQKLAHLKTLPTNTTHALLRFLQGTRNSIHGSKFIRSNTSPDRATSDRACRIALSTYKELRNLLLVHLAKNFHRMKIPAPTPRSSAASQDGK